MFPGGGKRFWQVDFSRKCWYGTFHVGVHVDGGEWAFIGVCAVRSDMAQLCICIPLAQAFSCPRWWYFSPDEKKKIKITQLYSFCDSFEITSSCIYETQTSQIGLMGSGWWHTTSLVKWLRWAWCIPKIPAPWHSCNPIQSAGALPAMQACLGSQ